MHANNLDTHQQTYREPTGSGFNKVVGLALIGIIAYAVWQVVQPSVTLAGWHEDLDAAIDAGRAQKKPVLVYYAADW